MLEELVVKNYALIDRLQVRFSPGLNILTGETGAGKSIMIGALGLVLGLKADTEALRAGASEIDVSGIVKLEDNPEVRSWLQEQGIEAEAETIIIRRVVKKNGKGIIFVQSAPFTLTALRELTGMLFDLHGQHEHQSLLSPENHRRLLDHFGGLTSEVTEFGTLHTKLLKLREEHAALIAQQQERVRKVELLEYAIQEIEDAKLKVGEEEQLKTEQHLLANHEKLIQLIEEVYSATAESRGGALGTLRQARASLAEIVKIDSSLSGSSRQLENVFFELEDFVESLGRYKGSIDFDPARLEQIEERLDLIKRLQKKYGGTIDSILAFLEDSRKQLEGLQNSDTIQKRLEEEISLNEKELKQKAATISNLRVQASTRLQEKIVNELIQLGMPKVRFAVQVEDRTSDGGKVLYSNTGKDRVEFLISPNPGEPYKKLAQIASGGELSRIMLAIKSVLAESDHINSLIFDEVDAGIGGEVAIAVGERLKRLAERKQVLCITHLATIAVRADNHIKVEKVAQAGRTVTRVSPVTGKERQQEIARMLAGDKTGDTSLKHAQELLQRYGIGKGG
ncbi:MAG: DNA repair protein RecN [Spirochaetaceae bacterium]|nr:MAG: DNA repair protein RecN [Spirochaetaceae bacterium]